MGLLEEYKLEIDGMPGGTVRIKALVQLKRCGMRSNNPNAADRMNVVGCDVKVTSRL